MNRPTASSSEFQRSQANVTILLIEDAETDRVTYARYLQSDPHYQYSVFNADKLQTGMALWRSQSPDVVLLDINLPDGSGLEFLQFLQSNWAKAKWLTKMPVIVITGQGSEQVAVQAMKLGAMEYLNKNDITADSLCKSLGEVIEYQTQHHQSFNQQQVEDQLRQRNQALEAQVAQQAAALQESKARLQEIEHIARLGHWQFDLLTGKMTWSREIFYIFRLDPNQPEPTFEQILQHFSEADRQRIEATIQRAVQTGESYELDVPFSRADGSPGCLFLRGNIIYDKQGQVVGRMGILMDISERYYIQAELRSLSDRLTLALESAAIGTWDWDLVHEAYWDERMYALYGLEHLQRPITYQDWANALHPDDRARVEQELELSLTQGKVDSEFRIVLPNGSIRFIKVMGLMHYDQLGQPQRMVGINYDITARKQVETTLALYTREVEDLYDKAPCGYHSLDSEGRYIRVNETELQWLGYAREEMLGQPFTAFLTEASRQIFFESYPDFRQRGWVKNLEFDMICKDNSILAVLINATAVKDEDGVYIYSRSTLLDIRDRRQIEQQLQQMNAELLRATRLKDEFLANMSHELRTPLNAILGMSESLLDKILGALNPSQMKAVTTIENSGKYLLELINDILDLAKISSGKMELILAPVSVQYLCNSSLPFIRQQALQKNIQIGCNIPPNINEAILDERRIRQVLINLLTNAVKFTPEGGQITLEAKHQSTEAAEGSCAWLLFSVIDTGVGIAPADVSRLFQPFVQVDSRLNRQQVGTGLGLAMVKQITELHGGYVIVDSQPGQGSCFTIALPYQLPDIALLPNSPLQPAVPSVVIPDQSEWAIAPMILLAEDNQANIATFTAYLSARHYRMIVAQDGEEAVVMAKAEQPDLILMDIQMPGLDGLEAIRQIRADEQLSAIPIIALTALAMPEDQVRCIVAGANQYLSKPVKLKQLAEAIRQWLPR